MIQFVYNISIYKVTKQTLFFINHKFYLIIYKILTIGLDNLYIVIKVEHLKFLYNKLKNELSFVRDRITKYYNIKKIKRPSFEKKTKCIYFIKTLLLNDQMIN